MTLVIISIIGTNILAFMLGFKLCSKFSGKFTAHTAEALIDAMVNLKYSKEEIIELQLEMTNIMMRRISKEFTDGK